MTAWQPNLGSIPFGDGSCRFRVWAPGARQVAVHLLGQPDRFVPLQPGERGMHQAEVEGVPPDSLYVYQLDGQKERPDPASRSQPRGVHGPSQVVDAAFAWTDQHWFGRPLREYILYEVHVGTFTPEGTLTAIIPHLQELRDLGITALSLMPLAQCPGSRNWGYDGVYPFAVQHSYGGPQGLKQLVDACHRHGLAVVLDVVYNHLGPEGNYLWDYGPYFTNRYRTPWGEAINFDGPDSDEVRRFFLDNALQWQTEFHIDGLRLDAIHAIQDHSAYPFLEELAAVTAEQAECLNRRFYLIAESNLNDTRVIRPRELGGFGLHTQWCDDLHHSLRTLLTGDRSGYYQDFGTIEHLARAFRDGFVYTGQHSPFRRRRHGNATHGRSGQQFVVFSQNHDQIGNRMLGDRLGASLPLESLKLAAAVVLLSPFVPQLFMGEEYGETAPFQFFTHHGDRDLIEAVRKGRREEFAVFDWQGECPDPQDEATFERSKLRRELRHQERHRELCAFYRELIRLRLTLPALANLSKENLEAVGFDKEKTLVVRRWTTDDEVCAVFHFGERDVRIDVPLPAGDWHKQLDSTESRWLGSGHCAAELIESDGTASLALGTRTVVLYRRS